jgi:hypothetical protein
VDAFGNKINDGKGGGLDGKLTGTGEILSGFAGKIGILGSEASNFWNKGGKTLSENLAVIEQ